MQNLPLTRPSLTDLIRLYLRVGITTFGGGYITIAALGRELVDVKGWLTQDDFGLAFGVARITPGTNIIAFCAATGARLRGLWGALAGAVTLTAPSAVLAVLLMQGYETWGTKPLVLAAFTGTIAAASGTLWSIVYTLTRPHITREFTNTLRTILIVAASFLASWKFNITPVPILAAATAVGLLWKDRPAAPGVKK